jgi:hypothetical protein
VSTHPLASMIQVPKSGTNSAKLLPLANFTRRHANQVRATKAVMSKRPTAAEGGGERPALTCEIIDFAAARNRGHRTQAKLGNETESNPTLTDRLVVVYLMASVAFYPTLVWFLLS